MRGALLFFALLGVAVAGSLWRLPSRRPQPDLAIAYGADPAQHGLLWRPAGAGPFPVAVLIHGGCWQTGSDNIGSVAAIANDLRRRGIAVWDIDYRGVDRKGGGYPGTFADVAAGIDALRRQAARQRLDLERLAFVGHSAGGHLALWAASRDRLPPASPLFRADPLLPALVVSLGGVADPRHFPTLPGVCGASEVAQLIGPPTPARPDPFADTVPAAPMPGRKVVLIDGAADTVVPIAQAAAFAARVPQAEHLTIPQASHVGLIDPRGTAWASAAARIEAVLKP